MNELLEGFTVWANQNPIVYKAAAMVYARYIPFGALDRLHEGQPLSEWWFKLAQKAACPGFDIDFNLLLTIYLYEMMGNTEFHTHFEYASYLENLSLVKDAVIEFDPITNQNVIKYYKMSINIPFLWPNFPHEAWQYVDHHRIQPSNGIITVLIQLQVMEGTLMKAKTPKQAAEPTDNLNNCVESNQLDKTN